MVSSDDCSLDVPAFVREALRRRDRTDGPLVIKNSQIEVGSRRKAKLERYTLGIYDPENDAGERSGFLLLHHPALGLQPRLVLLLGTPIGFNEFAWRAYCPKTRKVHSSLYFDPSTSLLVARSAIASPPPAASHRLMQNLAMIDAMKKGVDPAHVAWDLYQDPGPHTASSMLAKRRIKVLKTDLLFAANGLPKATWRGNEKFDILGLIKGPNRIERYPLNVVMRGLRAALKSEQRKASRGKS